MKLYTRTGDDGTTGLFGAARVGKDHPRIEAYGTVDELNAWLGMCASACHGTHPAVERMRVILVSLQSRLFDLGADLATPPDASDAATKRVSRIEPRHVAEAESYIDEIDSGNEAIRAFVLPGGSELAARLHVARTVCRRAERLSVALARSGEVGPGAIHLLNRLSDLLFAMARRANKAAGQSDIEWRKNA
ncbi:MAG: cob(I)yrinic acid a,c-diamide adenosyltransferase [Phycisphaerales bacterium]|nr:cob(I)yrinic acid a,c-diamide adenosyltransferase [Phycisphaerales bacterium]